MWTVTMLKWSFVNITFDFSFVYKIYILVVISFEIDWLRCNKTFGIFYGLQVCPVALENLDYIFSEVLGERGVERFFETLLFMLFCVAFQCKA